MKKPAKKAPGQQIAKFEDRASSATQEGVAGVEAPDPKTAEVATIRAFDLNYHQRKRLMVRERA
ncbi:MAG: hypothetical protein WAV78_19895 [Xanthobacteraceae bacterium]